ncbi:MAG: hypothetical protein WAU96_16745 [Anaerolineae bacterium]
MAEPTNRDQTAFHECTRDPIFLFRIHVARGPIVHRVFLTRKEADDYGEQNAHNYKKWSVFCIPCEGNLAQLLKEHGDKYIVQPPAISN